jgi:hypothetical protein
MKRLQMRALSMVVIISALVCGTAHAETYYDEKWFDFPDLSTAPQVTCPDDDDDDDDGVELCLGDNCLCSNPETQVLRRDVRVVVTGPDAPDDALRNALLGYAAGCVAGAIAASTAGPQVIASPAGFYASFKACIFSISASGIAGGILNQFDIHLDTSDTHWAPL